MVFCNKAWYYRKYEDLLVTILILIDGFLQLNKKLLKKRIKFVTILILIDGFLQYGLIDVLNAQKSCHNPYFNRWFSAIGTSHLLQ